MVAEVLTGVGFSNLKKIRHGTGFKNNGTEAQSDLESEIVTLATYGRKWLS